MRKFLTIIALLLMCIPLFNIEYIYATEHGEDVSIMISSNDKEQYSKQFDANVTINFIQKDLYNENVYLSYHVVDDNGKEILWEGKRFPLSFDSDGKTSMNVNLDLSYGTPTANVHKGKIKFDLVDEENAYWFSTNTEISFSSEEINLDDSFSKRLFGTLAASIGNNPIIFSVNLICFLIFVLSFYKIKKSELFYK